MGHEVFVTSAQRTWMSEHAPEIADVLAGLPTFVGRDGREVRLRGTESRAPAAWTYDVRVFVDDERLLVEISAHPASIERDLRALFAWLRARTTISVTDDDGVALDR